MYYEPGSRPHGLPWDPFKSCIVPRPIGWISTTSAAGVDNLAPFSQFQQVSYDPPTVLVCVNQTALGARKDTAVNIADTGEFVWNMATYAQREAVNLTATDLPHGTDEFIHAGLGKLPSRHVRPPRVAGAPVHFECRHLQTVRIDGNSAAGTVDVIFGRVIAVHIDDAAIDARGRLDILALRPLARLGYHDYTSVESAFEMPVLGSPARKAGLEGSAEKMAAAVAAMKGDRS
jgi:flavin reductase (DIM6/NTAB) family NADH-FMN oxidoreductase RutF